MGLCFAVGYTQPVILLIECGCDRRRLFGSEHSTLTKSPANAGVGRSRAPRVKLGIARTKSHKISFSAKQSSCIT